MDESTQMRLLGQRIRSVRENLGLSQEDLAHKWGKKQYQISEYENGKRRIYAHDLPQLANVLNVSISYLFDIDEEHANNPSEEMLVQVFRNLGSKSAQEFALKVLSDLRTMLDAG